MEHRDESVQGRLRTGPSGEIHVYAGTDESAGLHQAGGFGPPSVFDKTGLTGKYTFTLSFTPPQGMGSVGKTADANAAPIPATSIFSALEEQLGLRLQPTSMTFDTIVVDHVERPAAN